MIWSDTQRLTRSDLELRASDGQRFRRLIVGAAVVVPLLAVGAALYQQGPGASLFTTGTLEAENATLRAELERVRTELDMDQATRNELDRQTQALNDQINDLTNRLEFLTTRNNPAATSR